MTVNPIVQGKQITWQDLCKQVLGSSSSNVRARRIGSLWGSYGSVTQLSADAGDETHRLIAKQVLNLRSLLRLLQPALKRAMYHTIQPEHLSTRFAVFMLVNHVSHKTIIDSNVEGLLMKILR